MIVEFIGLPGSGKTFISELLSKESGYKIAEKRNLTLREKCFIAVKSLFIRVYLVFLIKTLFSFKISAVKLKRLYGLSILNNYKTDKSKITLYDQHLIQYLISFYFLTSIKPNKKNINDLLIKHKFPKNALVIYNDVNLKTVVERFKSRKSGLNHNKTLLDSLDDAQLFKAIDKLKMLSDTVFDMLKELNIKVVHWTNNSHNDIEFLKQQIQIKIKE